MSTHPSAPAFGRVANSADIPRALYFTQGYDRLSLTCRDELKSGSEKRILNGLRSFCAPTARPANDATFALVSRAHLGGEVVEVLEPQPRFLCALQWRWLASAPEDSAVSLLRF